MAVVLASSVSSLGVQRRLGEANRSLISTYERLSSGLRINRASNDAAGLAVASSLNVDQRVYSQGIRNVNDGLSLLSIADGALQELTNITYRIEELAEQAANGTLSTQQRSVLDREAQSLRSEFLRIRNTTQFNNSNLLNGTIDELKIQLGYGSSGRIEDQLGGAIGTGSYSPALLSGISATATTSQIADVNGDGHIDLIAGSTGSSTLSVYLANGDGSFKGGSNSNGVTGANSIEIADFNGDGILDIVNSSGTRVEYRQGAGDGTFTSIISYLAAGGTGETSSGDINGDGYSDVILSATMTGVYGFFGSSSGLVTAGLVINNGSAGFTDSNLADLDADGVLDIVVGDYNSSSFKVYRGNGNGTFKLQQSSVGSLLAFASSPVVYSGDVNNDGKADLLAWSGIAGSNLQILIGNGNGTFKAGTAGPNISSDYFEAGDLNGDGHIDIAGVSGNIVYLMLANGNGTFSAERSFASGGTGSVQLKIADLNANGVLDLLTLNDSSNNVSALLASTISGVSPLLNFDLKSMAGARTAIPIMEQKRAMLAKHRGELGGLQSRLASGLSSLHTSVESYAEAESRIRDADIAEEAAVSVRLSILQQAGTALLAQANNESKLALTLLGSAAPGG